MDTMKTNEDLNDVVDSGESVDEVEVSANATSATPVKPYDTDEYYDIVAPIGYPDEADYVR